MTMHCKLMIRLSRRGQDTFIRKGFATFSFLPELDKNFTEKPHPLPMNPTLGLSQASPMPSWKTLLDASRPPTATQESTKKFSFLEYLENKDAFFNRIKQHRTHLSANPPQELNRAFSFANAADMKPVLALDHHDLDEFTMRQMMQHGVHLGHSKHVINAKMAPYILGIRQDIHIIDLEQTLHCLKRALLVIREVSKLDGVILIVGTRPSIKHLTCQVAHQTQSYYIHDRWQKGTLTNAAHVVKKTGSFLPGSRSETVVRLPDLLIILDGPSNDLAMQEATARHIPTVALCDTNMDPTLVTYPIPANDDSVDAVSFFVHLFKRAILAGKHSS